jgi:hypothetical protein
MKQARASEHTRVGFLDEVLGVLAGAGERPGGPVEPVDVVPEPSRVERPPRRATVCDGGAVPARAGLYAGGKLHVVRYGAVLWFRWESVDDVLALRTVELRSPQRLSAAAAPPNPPRRRNTPA